MTTVNWDELSRLGKLRAAIDPNDSMGFKNMLIDHVHWMALSRHLKGSRNVLDFGCGTGRFARRIISRGIRYTGIDRSNGMIRAARDWHHSSNIVFQHFDGIKIPFDDQTFDTVIASRVFIHLLKTTQCEAILAEIRRVLTPGGQLILLEEASLSGKKSGQAPLVLTEDDFISVLSQKFNIKEVQKVRSSEFSKLSRRLTEWGDLPYFWFRLILGPLALFELWRAQKSSNEYFSTVTYYDFLIHTELRNN